MFMGYESFVAQISAQFLILIMHFIYKINYDNFLSQIRKLVFM